MQEQQSDMTNPAALASLSDAAHVEEELADADYFAEKQPARACRTTLAWRAGDVVQDFGDAGHACVLYGLEQSACLNHRVCLTLNPIHGQEPGRQRVRVLGRILFAVVQDHLSDFDRQNAAWMFETEDEALLHPKAVRFTNLTDGSGLVDLGRLNLKKTMEMLLAELEPWLSRLKDFVVKWTSVYVEIATLLDQEGELRRVLHMMDVLFAMLTGLEETLVRLYCIARLRSGTVSAAGKDAVGAALLCPQAVVIGELRAGTFVQDTFEEGLVFLRRSAVAVFDMRGSIARGYGATVKVSACERAAQLCVSLDARGGFCPARDGMLRHAVHRLSVGDGTRLVTMEEADALRKRWLEILPEAVEGESMNLCQVVWAVLQGHPATPRMQAPPEAGGYEWRLAAGAMEARLLDQAFTLCGVSDPWAPLTRREAANAAGLMARTVGKLCSLHKVVAAAEEASLQDMWVTRPPSSRGDVAAVADGGGDRYWHVMGVMSEKVLGNGHSMPAPERVLEAYAMLAVRTGSMAQVSARDAARKLPIVPHAAVGVSVRHDGERFLAVVSERPHEVSPRTAQQLLAGALAALRAFEGEPQTLCRRLQVVGTETLQHYALQARKATLLPPGGGE